MKRTLMFAALLGGACIAATAAAAAAAPETPNRKVAGLPNPYVLTTGWGTLPAGRTWGNSAAAAVDIDGKHIWAIDRCGSTNCVTSSLDPVLRFSPEGKVVGSLGGGRVMGPHGIHVDREGNVWVTDNQSSQRYWNGRVWVNDPSATKKMGYQVLKFAPDGRLLLTVGTAGEQGAGDNLFASPTDVVTAPNGDIFVSDGHLGNGNFNARIVKFDKNGKFIKSFGALGDGAGQFFAPHALAMDSQGRLFVADRSNHRVVIYSQDGVQLEEWRQFGRPSDLHITPDDKIYVTDSESGILGYNLAGVRGITIGNARTGEVTAFIPDTSSQHIITAAAAAPLAEGLTVDAAGNIYGAVVNQRDRNLMVWRPTAAAR